MQEILEMLSLPSFLTPVFKGIAFVLFWIFVPGIMLGVVISGNRLAARVSDKEMKTSAKAGWSAGMVLFVFFFIYQIPNFRIPNSLIDPSITLSWWGAIAGSIGGFVVLFGLRALIETRAIGLITILLSFSGSASLYSYFFIRLHNDILMSGALGLAFGALLYVVIFPKQLHEILSSR